MAGVYISYPFCRQKCTYCNFASGVQPAGLEAAYVRSLLAEIGAAEFPFTPETIYFGGGTPSTMESQALDEVMRTSGGREWAEATIEAAPGSITAELARSWARSGVNRVSLGVQSFVEAELRPTARRHTAKTIEDDVETLRRAGIPNISVDLIAGLPNQTSESWQESLDALIRLEVPHASVYMLEVDEDSRLGLEILNNGSKFSAAAVPTEAAIVEFYESAVDFLAQYGLERYEISNFARPAKESLHNLKYWRLEPYLGFGADAHSMCGGRRWQNVETAAEYAGRFEAGQLPVLESHPARIEEEYFFLGLRMTAGVEADQRRLKPHQEAVERHVAAGLLEISGGRLRLTRRGVLLSNEVFGDFLLP